MSEAEKQRRYDYKQQRKKWLMIQAIAIAVVAVLVLSSFLVYAKLNKTYYIHYKENANVDYKVQISDNDFYDEEYLKREMPTFHHSLKISWQIFRTVCIWTRKRLISIIPIK